MPANLTPQYLDADKRFRQAKTAAEKISALEDMLAAYDGTVILVSHDRAFLDGVATQIIGPLGDGRWVETPGRWEGCIPLRPGQPAWA